MAPPEQFCVLGTQLIFLLTVLILLLFSQSGLTLSALAVSDNGNFVATGSMSEVITFKGLTSIRHSYLSI